MSTLPVTPTFLSAELSINPLTTPTNNIDFDTAAFMLMASNVTPNHHNLIPNHHTQDFLNDVNTPPPFDFDSIGQMLMSPSTNNHAHAFPSLQHSHEHDFFNMNIPSLANVRSPQPPPQQQQQQQAPSALQDSILPFSNYGNYPLSSVPSPRMDTFGKFPSPLPQQHPTTLSSAMPTLPRFLNPLSPSLNMGSLEKQNHLLSNTESLALESFLDSIASNPAIPQSQKTNVKKEEVLSPYSDSITATEGILPKPSKRKAQDHTTPTTKKPKITAKAKAKVPSKPKSNSTPKSKNIKKECSEADDCVPKQPKKDRKITHNITEKKRRDMIKTSFDHLQALIKSSKFDLQDPDAQSKLTQRQRRRNERQLKELAEKGVEKPLKKFEVLRRGVREIELLLESINKLKKEVGK